MSDKVTQFCDSVHDKLQSLQGRIDSLKLNIGTTWHSLQEKLDEVRHQHEVKQRAVAEGRASLEKWFGESKAETKSTIEQWIAKRETQKLAVRCQRAEECAWMAIMLAQASIDDAERMILEAISAKLDAEAVAHS